MTTTKTSQHDVMAGAVEVLESASRLASAIRDAGALASHIAWMRHGDALLDVQAATREDRLAILALMTPLSDEEVYGDVNAPVVRTVGQWEGRRIGVYGPRDDHPNQAAVYPHLAALRARRAGQ